MDKTGVSHYIAEIHIQKEKPLCAIRTQGISICSDKNVPYRISPYFLTILPPQQGQGVLDVLM